MYLRTAIAKHGGLCSRADLARRWGVTKPTITEMTRQPDFPTPVTEVNGRPVWAAVDCDQWRSTRTTRRKGGTYGLEAQADAVAAGAERF
jgi:predicted DNA-binding transcriptional regulator AlpA